MEDFKNKYEETIVFGNTMKENKTTDSKCNPSKIKEDFEKLGYSVEVGDKTTQTADFRKYDNLQYINTATIWDRPSIEEIIKGNYLHWSHLNQEFKTGQKFNSCKLPMSVLKKQFPNALKAIVKCSQYGHNKYPDDVDWMNYSRVEGGSTTYRDAAERHSLDTGLDESGLPHVFHELWNKIAEVELWIEENNYKF